MTNRYFYQENIATFLAEDTNSIFGKMSRADEMDRFSDEDSLFAGQPNEKQKWKSPFLICTICTAVPLHP